MIKINPKTYLATSFKVCICFLITEFFKYLATLPEMFALEFAQILQHQTKNGKTTASVIGLIQEVATSL